MINRILNWLFHWSRLGQSVRYWEHENDLGYRMYRRGFLYKEGRVDEAIPTWMVNHEKMDR